MTSRQSQLQEDTAFRVLRILEAEPDISQRALADRLGLSLGGLNYCLKALGGAKGLALGEVVEEPGKVTRSGGMKAHPLALAEGDSVEAF